MEKTSNVQSLRERLQEQTAQDTAEVAELMRLQLKTLEKGFQSELERVLSTTSKDISYQLKASLKPIQGDLRRIQKETDKLSRSLAKAWLKPFLIGLSLCLGICLSGWGVITYLNHQITTASAELQSLRQNVNALQQQTGGIRVHRYSNGAVLYTMSNGKSLEAGYEISGQPAWKSVNE